MNINPYAPPLSSVVDRGTDERELPRRSTILAIVGANAALVGLFCLLAGLFSITSGRAQGRGIGGIVLLGIWGLIAVAAAIDIFRRRRWAVIAWSVLTALFAIAALVVSFKRHVGVVVIGFLAAQFVGSLIGMWVMLNKNKRAKAIAPELG